MYIARQAVLNRNLEVYGYELLFRSSNSSAQFDGISAVQATASVLGGLFENGLDQIVENKRALVNFDREFLLSDALELIDSERLIIEVLENVEVDEKLMERLSLLKNKGYGIALDDFVESYSSYPLIPLADIIKFDIMATPLESIAEDVKRALSQKKILLAEKIENQREFLLAKEMGFQLFQGYFFQKPQIVSQSSSHTTTKSQYGRLIVELNKEEPSYQALAEIIGTDANLSYRLLRLISPRAGDTLVYSIKNALTYMGLQELNRWIHVLMVRELSDSKPDELIRISLIRTKLAELIAVHSRYKKYKYEAALIGLFSTIDAMLNQNMEEALKGISLQDTILEALIQKSGLLYPIYLLIISYEHGEWTAVEQLSGRLNINEKTLYEDYKFAIQWAKEVMDIF
jgi:EAL and modified HD-GYP domain-containing signal transduction protein